jgi:uncharacterized membrane protein YfcA
MGVVLGLMGGGGSILTVPIMVYLFGVQPATATGYSLFVVGITALIGSLVYIKKGDIDFKTGTVFAIPSVLGVFLSRAVLVPSIPETLLILDSWSLSKDVFIMSSFATLMLAASYSMINGRKNRSRSFFLTPGQRLAMMGLLGLIVGILAGFVGAGGGFLIIPALVAVAGLEMRVAVGTSLMIIAFQSLLGFTGDLRHAAAIDWGFLLSVATVAALGIALGSTLSHKFKEQGLKVTFGWFVLLMGAVILIEQLRHF